MEHKYMAGLWIMRASNEDHTARLSILNIN
jgi:hypothetical protein